MTRILVTTDGSPLGHHALSHAQALATALGAHLTALAIQLDPMYVSGEFAYVPPVTPEELAEQTKELRDDLTARLPGATVRVESAGGRHVSRAILDVIQQEEPDLIVMSTHGRSGLGRALLGSVAETVAHLAPAPVMLVKGDQRPAPWSAAPQATASR